MTTPTSLPGGPTDIAAQTPSGPVAAQSPVPAGLPGRKPGRRRSGAGSMALASPRERGTKVAASITLIAIGVVFFVPLAWIVLASVDPSATVAIGVPSSLTLDNFTTVLTPDLTFVPLWNSVMLSGGTAVVTVVIATLAAYPLSRYQMRWNKSFLYTVLFASCLPITAVMVPVYALFVSLGLLDSVPGTVLFLAATSLPMAIWMMKNFIDSVPVSLEEAAWVDGASAMQALARVVVPLMRPGLSVVFIFVFTQAWGNFFVPFVLLLDPDKQPAAVSIYNFFGVNGAIAYGQLAAFSVLYTLPVLFLYLLVQRLSGGFALAGGVKG